MATQDTPYPNALRVYVKQSGYTKREVSKETAIPEATLHDWAAGHRPIPHRARQVIARLLGCDEHDLSPLFQSHRLQVPQKATLLSRQYDIHKNCDESDDTMVVTELPIANDSARVPFADIMEMKSEHAISLPSSPLLLAPLPSGRFSGERSTWFSLKQALIETVVKQWHGRAAYCDELQAMIDQELHMFDLVKSLYTSDVYTTSRRSVLQAIATFPMIYLGVKQRRRLFNPHPEEFLPECTASIVACWQLLNDEKEGLSIIEAVLPLYLPTLVSWSRQNTWYRQTAASLGSQGNLLMALVAYHRFQFRAYASYCQQAVELAALSMDANLHAYALIWLGSAQAYNGQPQAELERIQEVSQYRARLIPALRCYLLAQAARVYAKQGQVQDALRAIGEARTLFVEKEGLPGFIASDYGPFALLLWEGMTYISLGDNDSGNAFKHYKRARTVFAESEKIAPTLFVPGRFDIELVNYRATVAIKEKNLADFLAHLKIGLEGVKTLGSEKRWQEIVANWNDAQQLWSREAEIVNLADAFH